MKKILSLMLTAFFEISLSLMNGRQILYSISLGAPIMFSPFGGSIVARIISGTYSTLHSKHRILEN
jgi:hypothetical protein